MLRQQTDRAWHGLRLVFGADQQGIPAVCAQSPARRMGAGFWVSSHTCLIVFTSTAGVSIS